MRLRFGSFAASQWARGFLRNCRNVMKPLVTDVSDVESRIRRQAQVLFDAKVAALPDKKGRLILAMCSLVLAAFRELEHDLKETAVAYDAVRQSFAMTYPAPMVWLFRVWLWFYGDPVKELQRRSMAKTGRRMYGRSMEFDEEKTDDTAEMLITRCAYHEFFASHGAPELTLLVCAWDRVWMDAVDRSPRPVRTERPSTISTGGDCCRFRFIRDAEKAGKDPGDIVLVQLHPLAAKKQ
ncbi:MAG TPA: L-2-amino-thiazoline-4-carboxylic acid hydrolase [Planctomycetaceae bacterium]|nr:L-2-amino-thiazoline-4-carboxylic acid hydrolase [Planctomycetaceae bacterium]